MRKKEWQNLYDELETLNTEFKAKIVNREEIIKRKQKQEIDIRLSYIMETVFSKVTSNQKAYTLLIEDLVHDETLIFKKLSEFTDLKTFSKCVSNYLEKVESKI